MLPCTNIREHQQLCLHYKESHPKNDEYITKKVILRNDEQIKRVVMFLKKKEKKKLISCNTEDIN